MGAALKLGGGLRFQHKIIEPPMRVLQVSTKIQVQLQVHCSQIDSLIQDNTLLPKGIFK